MKAERCTMKKPRKLTIVLEFIPNQSRGHPHENA